MNCETCKHYRPTSVLKGGKPGEGECWRFPPSAQFVSAPQGVMKVCTFPVVQKDWTCGEHSVKIATFANAEN